MSRRLKGHMALKPPLSSSYVQTQLASTSQLQSRLLSCWVKHHVQASDAKRVQPSQAASAVWKWSQLARRHTLGL